MVTTHLLERRRERRKGKQARCNKAGQGVAEPDLSTAGKDAERKPQEGENSLQGLPLEGHGQKSSNLRAASGGLTSCDIGVTSVTGRVHVSNFVKAAAISDPVQQCLRVRK